LTRRIAFIVLLIALAAWHAWPFLAGYRVTADSVFFLDSYLRNAEEIWQITLSRTQWYGRIGFHGLLPLNMVGAYLSEFLVWRMIFVGLYLAMVGLVFVYAAQLLRTPLASVAFLIWLALHPLAFEHMPPVAYPLQNTLPFILLVGARLWMLSTGDRGAALWLGRTFQILAMLLIEYAALLGIVMIGAEAFLRHPLRDWRPRNWLHWPLRALRDPVSLRDIFMLLMVFGPYMAYRLVYPPQYSGVQLDGALEPGRLIYTTLRHVTDGSSLPRLIDMTWQFPPAVWVLALVWGAALSVASWIALSRLAQSHALRRGAITLYVCFAILLVTLPLSATSKLQTWCVDRDVCAYVDSRTSLLGVVLLLVIAISALPLRQIVVRSSLAVLLGTTFAATSLHNWQIVKPMAAFADVWEGAEALACVPELGPKDSTDLRTLIDPAHRVRLVYAEKKTFWPRYLMAAAEWTNCEEHPVLERARTRSYLPILTPGETHQLGAEQSRKYLGSGWSVLQHNGVWTDGPRARLHLLIRDVEPKARAKLDMAFHGFFDDTLAAQRLRISQEGVVLWDEKITRDEPEKQITLRLLPHSPERELISLELTLPDARPPANGKDSRDLGIFLTRLGLR